MEVGPQGIGQLVVAEGFFIGEKDTRPPSGPFFPFCSPRFVIKL